jgi:hypothetical protein
MLIARTAEEPGTGATNAVSRAILVRHSANGARKRERNFMPVRMRKLTSGKVRVSTPGGVKAKATTAKKAKAQTRLLNAIEHGWKPTRK